MRIQNQLKYHGIFRFIYGAPELAAEDAEEDVELLMMISLLLEVNCSTCFPHLGHTMQSSSISSPQCLQYFFFSFMIDTLLICFSPRFAFSMRIMYFVPLILQYYVKYGYMWYFYFIILGAYCKDLERNRVI